MFISAWLISLIASFGSLFFSEVMGFVPCSLCWYQRIFMYPIFFVLTVGLYTNDKKAFKYVWPLAIVGWLISFYHNLLMWKIIPESAAPCKSGIPCSTVYLNLLGFINIPLMSLAAFSLILIIMFASKKCSD